MNIVNGTPTLTIVSLHFVFDLTLRLLCPNHSEPYVLSGIIHYGSPLYSPPPQTPISHHHHHIFPSYFDWMTFNSNFNKIYILNIVFMCVCVVKWNNLVDKLYGIWYYITFTFSPTQFYVSHFEKFMYLYSLRNVCLRPESLFVIIELYLDYHIKIFVLHNFILLLMILP